MPVNVLSVREARAQLPSINAVAQGNASLRAEGLHESARAEVIIDEWVHGRISTSEMEEQIAALHDLSQ